MGISGIFASDAESRDGDDSAGEEGTKDAIEDDEAPKSSDDVDTVDGSAKDLKQEVSKQDQESKDTEESKTDAREEINEQDEVKDEVNNENDKLGEDDENKDKLETKP